MSLGPQQSPLCKVPSSVYKSDTVELILEIDSDVIERHDSRSYERVDIISDIIEQLPSTEERIVKKIALNRRSVFVEFTRSLNEEDVENWNSHKMTGMNVSWYYTSPSVQAERKFVDQKGNFYFRKIVSLVHNKQHQSEEQLWRAARLAKMKQDLNFCYGNLFTSSFDGKTSQLLTETMKNLGVKNIPVRNTSDEISDETMELATKIFVYLGSCPKQYWHYWDIWMNFYTDILRNHSVRTFLLTLSRMSTSSREKGRKEFELSLKLSRKLSDIFQLPGGEFSPSDPGRA